MIRKEGFFSEIYKNRYIYLLALPGIIFLVIFAYIPMFGHIIAFKNLQFDRGIIFSPWVGMRNFQFLFRNPDWLSVTINTIKLNSLFIIFGMGGALVIALLLNEIKTILFKRISQSLIFLPYFVSWMIVSFMIYTVLNYNNGIANRFLAIIGEEAVSWYSRPEYWTFILVIMYSWKFTGYFSVIFLAAITGISVEYYESARIDGANRLQQALYITLPVIRPTIIVLVLLAIGRIFYGDFGMIYSIIGDNAKLFPVTDVIDTFTYRALRQSGNIGMASAVALYQSCLGMVTVILFNTIVKHIEKSSALF